MPASARGLPFFDAPQRATRRENQRLSSLIWPASVPGPVRSWS